MTPASLPDQVCSIVIACPPETVWDEITKTKVLYRIQSWFMWALPKTTRTGYAEKQGW